MSAKCRLAALGLGAAVLLLSLGCQCLFLIPWPPADPLCAEAPYSPPPSDFSEQDLVGTWQTTYDEIGVDQLTIKGDGTFKQVYEERVAYVVTLYRYETPWNHWRLERFPDGRIRVHFEGARYYYRGCGVAESDGMPYGSVSSLPWPFRDPFSREYVEMVGKLVLNVRVDSRGELLLHQMLYSADEGFPLTGCQKGQFRRVETP